MALIHQHGLFVIKQILEGVQNENRICPIIGFRWLAGLDVGGGSFRRSCSAPRTDTLPTNNRTVSAESVSATLSDHLPDGELSTSGLHSGSSSAGASDTFAAGDRVSTGTTSPE